MNNLKKILKKIQEEKEILKGVEISDKTKLKLGVLESQKNFYFAELAKNVVGSVLVKYANKRIGEKASKKITKEVNSLCNYIDVIVIAEKSILVFGKEIDKIQLLPVSANGSFFEGGKLVATECYHTQRLLNIESLEAFAERCFKAKEEIDAKKEELNSLISKFNDDFGIAAHCSDLELSGKKVYKIWQR